MTQSTFDDMSHPGPFADSSIIWRHALVQAEAAAASHAAVGFRFGFATLTLPLNSPVAAWALEHLDSVPMDGHVKISAPPEVHGFDAKSAYIDTLATVLGEYGYRPAVRYILD